MLPAIFEVICCWGGNISAEFDTLMCLEELGSLFHDREQPALSMLFDYFGCCK